MMLLTFRICSRTLAGLILWQLFASTAFAHSWAIAKTREFHSANGKYIAKVIPTDWLSTLPMPRLPGTSNESDGDAPKQSTPQVARVIVYTSSPRRQVWSAELHNSTAPLSVFVSNDGKNVVTLDDWGHPQRGADTIAFYGPEGHVKSWQIEATLQLTPGEIEELQAKVGLPRSVLLLWLSQHWRENRLVFLSEDSKRIAIWVDSFGKWLVWRLPGGDPIALNAQLRNHWNQTARRWAIEKFSTQSASLNQKIHAFCFLASLQGQEDRALLQQTLKSAHFDTSPGSRFRQEVDSALELKERFGLPR